MTRLISDYCRTDIHTPTRHERIGGSRFFNPPLPLSLKLVLVAAFVGSAFLVVTQ